MLNSIKIFHFRDKNSLIHIEDDLLVLNGKTTKNLEKALKRIIEINNPKIRAALNRDIETDLFPIDVNIRFYKYTSNRFSFEEFYVVDANKEMHVLPQVYFRNLVKRCNVQQTCDSVYKINNSAYTQISNYLEDIVKFEEWPLNCYAIDDDGDELQRLIDFKKTYTSVFEFDKDLKRIETSLRDNLENVNKDALVL